MQNDIKDILNRPVEYIKGVGNARAMLFHKINVYKVEDAITYFPREYEDRRNLKKIFEMEDSEVCSFEGIIASNVHESRPRKGLSIYKVTIKDGTGTITAVWFNQKFIKNIFRMGQKYVFFGKVIKKNGFFEIQSPVYEKVDNNSPDENICKIVPIYPSTAKLTQKIIRTVIRNAIDMTEGNLEEVIPDSIRNSYFLSEINYSIQNIHFPKSDKDFENARYSLVFEELLILQLALLSIKNCFNDERKGIVFKKDETVYDFINNLPFKLTKAQKNVFNEIEKDMESNKAMNRLVQGDVGSGKTIVAVIALLKAVKSGYQGVLMVPTEILAEQHYRTISGLLHDMGINVSLLTGSQTKKQKNEILKNIGDGNIDIVIGTHALIEENVTFNRLGLVVTDEQHRFGVRQRALLSQKGDNPDIIVMTATPIPRTLALILYGDLDISIINELPPGRKPIETYVVNNSMRERVNGFIRKLVAEGRQVYVVCPLVEDSEDIEAKSASEMAKMLENYEFKDLSVGLIHGKMKPKDKENVMSRFVNNEINILVSTTVIEVGVNVPNATIMVIENAERFGLAQLHQLRGRVGRGEHQSYCILYNESRNKISKERMNVMKDTNDGFVIAEKDLELRGPGDFFGTRQHGIPDLKIANLYKDMSILKKAQEAAFEIINGDRQLEKKEHKRLKEMIYARFSKMLNELSLN